jgi:hypothetical protein
VPHYPGPRADMARQSGSECRVADDFGTLCRNRCPLATARKTVSRPFRFKPPHAVKSDGRWILVLRFTESKPVPRALTPPKPVPLAPQNGAGRRRRSVSPRFRRALPLLVHASTTTVSHWTID